MATSSNNPAIAPRYGLGRAGGPSGAQNSFNTPAAAYGSNAKTQQRIEAERMERDRRLREERERMEQAGQNSLAELGEEQREEINEAVSEAREHVERGKERGG
ncbi:hypothetical protein K491DRAFT_675159 [Lophiostoma macrostomum CBS 122681]|uniref:Uncharacterized protein n=1 Tax=Lophiostoma macrostomum CBS 122681 TaxID=1314788 RepID=A0A6A6TJF3_9PLEO|nr:hypothetical protein K491DRAFT_675159 [Lophiostoma macrostomum CBS 122681]